MASNIGNRTINLLPLIIIITSIILINSAIVTGVREGELNIVFGVLRARGYHLFANALATSDIHYDLKSNGNFTLFAPINSALFAIDMTMAASNYVSTLRYHIVPRRMSIANLLSLPPPSNSVPTLVPGHDIVVEQRRSPRSLITVGGVDIVVPGMFYGRDIAVHGLEGILEYRSHSRNIQPANLTVSGTLLSSNSTLQTSFPEVIGNYTFQFPSPSPPPPRVLNDTVTAQSPPMAVPTGSDQIPQGSDLDLAPRPNQAPVLTRAKLLELSSDGVYSVLPSSDHLRQFTPVDDMAVDCSVANNGGDLVNDLDDAREVHVMSHMICAQK